MDLAIKRGANGYRIGDSHHRADLTDHEVEVMRQLREAGMKLRELAAKFDVSKQHAAKVCTFKARCGR
jgi:predicted DNA-binding protein (UPF0251 family)